jgi:hypothetical protein
MTRVQKGKKIIDQINDSVDLPEDAYHLERLAIELATSEWDARYKLGHVLAALLSKGDRGYLGGKYTSFGRFCRGELGKSESNCRALIAAATSFSRQQFRQFGVAKCALVARLVKNPGDRRRAVAMMAEGKRMIDIMRVFAPNWQRSVAMIASGDDKRPKSFDFVQREALKLSTKQRLALASALFESLKNKEGVINATRS